MIQDAIAQDYMNRVPVNEAQIINTGEGTMLFRDHASGRDFLHDKVKIEQACNRLNRTLLSFDYVSLMNSITKSVLMTSESEIP